MSARLADVAAAGTHWISIVGLGALTVLLLACGHAPTSPAAAAPPGEASPTPSPPAPARTASMPPKPFALRRPACVTGVVPGLEFLGDAAQEARDVVLFRSDDAPAPRLVIAKDAEVGDAEAEAIRTRVREGALVYVDAWAGDEMRLLRLAPGGTLRELGTNDPPLRGPRRLSRVPEAHRNADRAGEQRIVAVEFDGRVRVVATVQDTLCHGCSCDALNGRREFAENLVAFAAELAKPNPAEPAPVLVRRASLDGTRLRAGADFVAPAAAAATTRLEVLSLTGDVVAHAEGALQPGASGALDVDAVLAAPFETLDHRVVATLTTEDAVLRDVRPLIGLVGATNLRILGSETLQAGGPGTMRVLVVNSLRGAPLAGVALGLRLVDEQGRELARADGISDAAGTAPLALDVPVDAPAKSRLVAEARSSLTTDRIETAVDVSARRVAHVLCDLPIHAPGDDLGVRALVVEQPSGRPQAGRQVQFEIVTPADRIVERATATTDTFGVASATLRIPSDTSTEDYFARVSEGHVALGQAPLRIERFETPTFSVAVSPEAPRWTAGRPTPLIVSCARFDGRPIADANVSVTLRSDYDPALAFFAWEGRTDERGTAQVAVVLSESEKAIEGLWRSRARLRLDVVARDSGGREVRTYRRVNGANEQLPPGEVVVFEPDGDIAPGRPGRVLVQAPERSGATIDVAVGDGPSKVVPVDEFGLAEVRIDDPRADTKVKVDGLAWRFSVSSEPLVLSVERRVVAQGGRVGFRVATTEPAAFAYVDAVRDGTVIATSSVPVASGAAVGEIRLPDAAMGPVALHAYVLRAGSDDPAEFVGDARAVLVLPREELRATVTPSRGEVRPGESLELDVNVADATGRGVPATVAVRVADEAVLSLVAAQPECARMLLVLDDFVRRATGRIGGHSAAGIASLAARRPLSPSEQRVADALFALLDRGVRYELDKVSLPDRIAAYPPRVRARFAAFGDGLTATLRVVLTGPLSPRPDERTEDIVQALGVAETAGAFDRAGLLDPWGSPLDLDIENGRLLARSDGPDAIPGTHDDATHAWDADATRGLHADWLCVHGVAFDESQYETVYVTRRAGRGGHGGGGFGGGGGSAGGSMGRNSRHEPPRMRRFFPAALHWSPSLRTSPDGRAVVSLTAPDALTTWRVDVVASDAAGHAADATASFVTSQPFAVDCDAPPALIVGDEVDVPVIVRSTRAGASVAAVTVEVSREGKLDSPAAFEVKLDGRGERSAAVRVLAVMPGALTIRLRARAGDDADAVERVVAVVAAGRPVVGSASLDLAIGDAAAKASLARPERAIAGADRAEVRIAATPIAAVLDGVESLLAKPHGCFEQTSSALYPDALALLYLKRVGRASPDVETRFRTAIDDGVGRLLSFEIEGGGFDWFGRAPAKPLLTAYGLHEWTDLAALKPSVRDVSERTAKWLASIQNADGTFPLTDAPYSWSADARGATAATAYVAWALARCGTHAGSTQRALDALRPRLAAEQDPYTLALAVAALAETDPADPDALAAAGRLAAMGRRDGGAMRFDAPSGGALHGRGQSARVEVTAVAALAAIRLARPEVLPAGPLLLALARDRQADGTWGTTQATVLALRALLAADPAVVAGDAHMTLRAGTRVRDVTIPAAERDLTKVVDVTDLMAGSASLAFEATSKDGGIAATLSLTSFVPFDAKDAGPSPLRLTVAPDRTSCGSGDVVSLDVRLANTGAAPVAMPLVEIPLPAGFAADAASVEKLRRAVGVERVEADSHSIVIYLRELGRDAPFAGSLAIRPRLSGRVTAPPASASPYYEPEARVHAAAATFTVK